MEDCCRSYTIGSFVGLPQVALAEAVGDEGVAWPIAGFPELAPFTLIPFGFQIGEYEVCDIRFDPVRRELIDLCCRYRWIFCW